MNEAGADRVVVCRVGGDRFALPVAAIREVVAARPLVRIPGAPEAVLGLANVHGTLVTTMSGRLLLGLPAGTSEWLVVLSMYQGRVGIEVEEVEDVHSIGTADTSRTFDLDALIRPLLGPEPTQQ